MPFEYVTNDGLVYDAIFRHFRNSFIGHLRSCLVAENGLSAPSVLKSAFGDEWQTIVERHERSQMAGSIDRIPTDDFDYLDIAYFERVVDHFYEFIIDERWLGTNAVSSKKVLVVWLREIKNVRDPAAHPAFEAIDLRDAIRAVDTARRVLVRIGTSHGLDALDRVERELISRTTQPQEIGAAAPLDDSLPTRETIVDEFVGRSAELERLRAFLNNPHRRRWMLVGDGGKGKTAIAYTFAREVIEASPPGLCAVFWLSAKRRKYQLDRVVDIPNPDFSNLRECFDRLLISYGHQEGLELSLEEKRSEALRLLDELPILLVVDDLDSVNEEDEDVIEFLTLEVPQTASYVLFTSRRKFAGMGTSTTVVLGLPDDEALEFVRSRWEGEGFEQRKLKVIDRQEIVKVCEGSPLYMGDLLRLIASTAKTGEFTPAQIIRDWSTKQGDAVRKYALQREMDMLTEKARQVLDGLAVAGRPVTVEEIAALTAFSDQVVTSAVGELQQLYLLNAPALGGCAAVSTKQQSNDSGARRARRHASREAAQGCASAARRQGTGCWAGHPGARRHSPSATLD